MWISPVSVGTGSSSVPSGVLVASEVGGREDKDQEIPQQLK